MHEVGERHEVWVTFWAVVEKLWAKDQACQAWEQGELQQEQELPAVVYLLVVKHIAGGKSEHKEAVSG